MQRLPLAADHRRVEDRCRRARTASRARPRTAPRCCGRRARPTSADASAGGWPRARTGRGLRRGRDRARAAPRARRRTFHCPLANSTPGSPTLNGALGLRYAEASAARSARCRAPVRRSSGMRCGSWRADASARPPPHRARRRARAGLQRLGRRGAGQPRHQQARGERVARAGRVDHRGRRGRRRAHARRRPSTARPRRRA